MNLLNHFAKLNIDVFEETLTLKLLRIAHTTCFFLKKSFGIIQHSKIFLKKLLEDASKKSFNISILLESTILIAAGNLECKFESFSRNI
jgi:hypothetical protein